MGQKIRISESELRRLIREAIEGVVGDNPTNPPVTRKAPVASQNQTMSKPSDAVAANFKNTWLMRISEIGKNVEGVVEELRQNLTALSPGMVSDAGIDQNKMNILRQADAMLIKAIGLIREFVSQ